MYSKIPQATKVTRILLVFDISTNDYNDQCLALGKRYIKEDSLY